MNDRQRTMAVLRYESYDRIPLIHFGYWDETLEKWAAEGHLSREQALGFADGNQIDREITEKLGFDFNWASFFDPNHRLLPAFEEKVVKEFADKSTHIQDQYGVILLNRPDAVSIPAEIDHLLKDRRSWHEHYEWRYEWKAERIDRQALMQLKQKERTKPYGLYCGSMLGHIRDVVGLENLSYLMVDDPELLNEMIEIVADLCYRNVETILNIYSDFDFGHFWEDICFKNGPLISPLFFDSKTGPHYKRITDLLSAYGIDIVTLDCDGKIDALIPTWVNNGVNTMFPIEVGTWNASIAPWRRKYGKEIRGVGGMNKTVFAKDRAAVDAEIERLKALVDLGGYIPCPDHRIAPDAKWDLVRYYCDRMRQEMR